MLAYQKMLSGQVGYISEPGRGFYPEHLTDAYPFIPSSFLRGETLDLFIPGSSGYLLRLLQVIHVVLLLIAAFYILKRLASKKWKNLSAEAGFFLYWLFYFSRYHAGIGITFHTGAKRKLGRRSSLDLPGRTAILWIADDHGSPGFLYWISLLSSI